MSVSLFRISPAFRLRAGMLIGVTNASAFALEFFNRDGSIFVRDLSTAIALSAPAGLAAGDGGALCSAPAAVTVQAPTGSASGASAANGDAVCAGPTCSVFAPRYLDPAAPTVLRSVVVLGAVSSSPGFVGARSHAVTIWAGVEVSPRWRIP